MARKLWALIVSTLVISFSLLIISPAVAYCTGSASTSTGSVRFVKAAESSFDRYTLNPSQSQIEWMRAHYSRMRTYSPYFDSRLSWFPDAWVYKDLYAIYVGSALAQQHPEWILKDSSGRKLYIPFGCSGSSCPQYAGDVGNPDFRAYWISQAAQTLVQGYRGLFIDDVNMAFRVGDGSGQFVAPTDPRTGSPMTSSGWRRYVAEFTEQIRAALPQAEIVHNALWTVGHDDPYEQRELLSADFIEMERGVNDAGIRGGGGTFGFETFLSHIDWLHAHGKSVVFDSNVSTNVGREYGLASYFLINTGSDGLGNDPGSTPDDWWRGYDVQLGSAMGGRYLWNGVLRRDFEHGVVLVNQPDAPQKTLLLERTYTSLAGGQLTSLALNSASGAVLLGDPPQSPAPGETVEPSPEPEPFPQPEPSPAPVPSNSKKPCKKRRRKSQSVALRSVCVVGRVRGANNGRARLLLQRKRGRRWVTLRRAKVCVVSRNSYSKLKGSFRKRFRKLPKGSYRVRARYLGSRKTKVSISYNRRFKIRSRTAGHITGKAQRAISS